MKENKPLHHGAVTSPKKREKKLAVFQHFSHWVFLKSKLETCVTNLEVLEIKYSERAKMCDTKNVAGPCKN